MDVHFTITTDPSADLRLVLDLNEMPGTYAAYFNSPSTFNAGIGVFDGNIWDRWAGGSLEKGGLSYAIVTHELLHGLGLAHPHDTGGSSTIMDGVIWDTGDYGNADLNQGIFTTMSYNTGYWTGQGTAPISDQYGVEIGPMALDIAVLQSIYGANTTHAAGKDTYWLPCDNQPGTGWQAIWDTGGEDTMRYDGWRDATMDLRAAHLGPAPGGGYVSSADGIRGGLTIANGVVIEKARGGSGDDTITGNGTANHLRGNSGEDVLRGRTGDDVLYGGSGTDVLSGGRGADRLNGGRGADILTGGGGADRFDFNTAGHSTADSFDTIKDFQIGTDILDLRGIDADRKMAGNQAFDLIGHAQFSAAGQLRMNMSGGDLYIAADRDGDGQADMYIRLLGTTYILGDDILL